MEAAKIPICGTDLLSHGVDNGRAIGHMLNKAEASGSVKLTLKNPLAEMVAGN